MRVEYLTWPRATALRAVERKWLSEVETFYRKEGRSLIRQWTGNASACAAIDLNETEVKIR